MEANVAEQKEKPDIRTAAAKRRASFQEEQREYLRGLGLMRQIQSDLESVTGESLPVVKFKTETRLKLLAKILPDTREVELTGPEGGELVVRISPVLANA